MVQFEVINAYTASMGAITFGTNYRLAGAFTGPAPGFRRLISFYTADGTVFVETGRTYLESSTYSPTNVTTDRAYDADATTIDELADVLGTLIADLKTANILS